MPKPKPDNANSALTYDSALAELQQIVRDIERDEAGIDQLSDQVKRASELIALCRQKLRQAEIEIEKMLV